MENNKAIDTARKIKRRVARRIDAIDLEMKIHCIGTIARQSYSKVPVRISPAIFPPTSPIIRIA
jgi:hypothetical protein